MPQIATKNLSPSGLERKVRQKLEHTERARTPTLQMAHAQTGMLAALVVLCNYLAQTNHHLAQISAALGLKLEE